MSNALLELLMRSGGDPKGIDTISPTKRNALLGLLADAAKSADDYANKPDSTMPMGKANPALSIFANLLGIPGTARTLDRLSYGEPITNAGKANVPLIPQDTADAAMTLGPLVAGAMRAAPAVSRAAGVAAKNAAVPGTLRNEAGAIVWHGSPHKFDAFDASKIGTGEGAQAYGHGLYLAESPDVATMYKNSLSRYDDLPLTGPVQAAGAMIDASIPEERMRATLQKMYSANKSIDIEASIEQARAAIAKGKGGALYKVDLPDEHIAKMLDWDKPLSEQAPEVQSALAQTVTVPGVKRGTRMPLADLLNQFKSAGMATDTLPEMRSTGQQTYIDLAQQFGDHKAATDALRAAGIPGIRYLDGGSRGAGAGTSNFVVFPGEENILQILARNGQPVK